jgi:hypothetical protein
LKYIREAVPVSIRSKAIIPDIILNESAYAAHIIIGPMKNPVKGIIMYP